jgi:K+-sensing histidine kinase KdpD
MMHGSIYLADQVPQALVHYFRTDNLIAVRLLVADVGAEWTEVRRDDPAQALIDFARTHHVTQIVVGPGIGQPARARGTDCSWPVSHSRLD